MDYLLTPLLGLNSRRAVFRPLARLLLALFLLDGLILSFAETWERHSPDDYRERVRQCREMEPDFVLLGGSPVSEGLDPYLIEGFRLDGREYHHGFSMGLPGGTLTDFFQTKHQTHPTQPKLILYGATASDINDARNEPHGAYSLMTFDDWIESVRFRPEAAEWTSRHYIQGRTARMWGAFHYRHGIRMWAAGEVERHFPGSCPESAREAEEGLRRSAGLRGVNGFAPAPWFASRRYSDMKTAGWVAPPFEYLNRYRTGSHLKYLPRLAQWCAERNTRLVIVDMPTTADLESGHPEEFREYRSRYHDLAGELHLTMIDANRAAVGLDDRHFADLIHLNSDGAVRLSKWLKTALNKLKD